MIEIRDIRKAYDTGGFVNKALDGVSITFRDNEFVAVLGPSGSGKTTLLNVLGGLDHADSGDIVINGVSTKNYRASDWDTYRNHRIGFIFQSYNLIPHQSVLSNVELALTLSNVSAAERRQRARRMLIRVGLGDHMDKKPNQLSGGQMQRVAIARALINDPDIVLADEPTGALDTETGIQVMNLLSEVAKDRLVIMVTHNPDLAEQYATRIVNIHDGKVDGDSDPYYPPPGAPIADTSKRGKASMGFLTALALSFNNLMTKKGRTFLTAFAGSIGIIGIAAILALSNGVNDYIATTEEEALTAYPLTITKSSFDITNLMTGMAGYANTDEDGETSTGSKLIPQVGIMSDMFAKVKNNDLRTFRAFLDKGGNGIGEYVNNIEYSYGLEPLIYKADTSKGIVKLNPAYMASVFQNGLNTSSFMNMGGNMSSFQQMLADRELVESQTEVVEGRWPERYDEAVLVLSRRGKISDYTLYSLGVMDPKKMEDMTKQALNGEDVEVPDDHVDFSYADAMKLHFKVVPAARTFQHNKEQDTWADMSKDTSYMRDEIKSGIDLKVVGIVKTREDANTALLSEGIAYTPELTQHLMKEAADSEIVKAQLKSRDRDVFTGKTFDELQDDQAEFDMENIFSVDEEALQNAFSFDTSALENLGGGSELDLSGMDMGNMKIDADKLQMDPNAMAGIFSEDAMRQIMQNAPPYEFTPQQPATPEGGQQPGQEGSESSSSSSSGSSSSSSSSPGSESSSSAGESGSQSASQSSSQSAADAGQQAPAFVPTIELTPEEQQQLTEEGNAVAAGFMAWLATTYPEKVAAMMAGEQLDTQALFQEYLTANPEVQQRMLQVAQPIAAKAQEQLQAQIQEQIQNSMQDYMTNVFAPYIAASMQELMTQAAQAMATQMALAMTDQLTQMTKSFGSTLSNAISGQLGGQMAELQDALQNGFSFDADAFANAISFNMTQEDLTSLLTSYMNADELSYDGNLKKLGYATEDNPESISIYSKNFEAKESVLGIIDGYNDEAAADGDDSEAIQYSDIAGVLMSSVTNIINMISLVLIAFVSISLVVSSIMIGIVTYISVLERKKEIGILRSLGASRGNIANVFNAETIIEGLIAGLFAIGVVLLVSIPVNAIIYELHDVPNVMQLPLSAAAVLVAISVFLTFIAGLLPSQKAAHADPVEALRSE